MPSTGSMGPGIGPEFNINLGEQGQGQPIYFPSPLSTACNILTLRRRTQFYQSKVEENWGFPFGTAGEGSGVVPAVARVSAVVPVGFLAQELPQISGVAQKVKELNRKDRVYIYFLIPHIPSLLRCQHLPVSAGLQG